MPKPRVNLTRFHGVFAPNSKHRALVTPAKRGKGNKPKAADEGTPGVREEVHENFYACYIRDLDGNIIVADSVFGQVGSRGSVGDRFRWFGGGVDGKAVTFLGLSCSITKG